MKFSELFEATEKELEKKFIGKKLTFIDPRSGEDLFDGLITTGEYGMYVTVVKSFDSYFKKGEDFHGVKFERDYIRIKDDDVDIAIWSEDWDKKYHR